MNELKLRYGCNPHQTPARLYMEQGDLPIRILNGSPGYINLCDALNGWQLVKELAAAIGLPAAASFKHVSPAGAAVGVPLSDTLKKAYSVEKMELSPLATAYARARGADMMSSFGDWAAFSQTIDLSTATLLKREVSDGIIAPGYEPEALALLKKKKNGNFPIVQIDPLYEPLETERRQIFGIWFEQKRNNLHIGPDLLTNVVTRNTMVTDQAQRDLLVALIGAKYTQSNSVCYAFDGQLIGVGAGQQSRIHCTRLAGAKADTWFLRQHPRLLDLPFRQDLGRPERNNAIDQLLTDHLSNAEENILKASFCSPVKRLLAEEKQEWVSKKSGVCLASDAFFPFRDNIDRCRQSGVTYIAQPGGSVRDDLVIDACNEYDMVMMFTKTRLFHH